jgi:hypothetical protein
MNSRERLVLAVEADTGAGLPITDQEAGLLGWIVGDGSIVGTLQTAPVTCPDCDWVPPSHSKRGPMLRPDLSVRIHRIREHGMTGRQVRDNLRAHVYQSKPENFAHIEYCLEGVEGVGRSSRDRRGRVTPTCTTRQISREWRLPAAYTRDLLQRAGNPKTEALRQVTEMSSSQRKAWLRAIIAAEGTVDGTRTVIYQNEGDIAEAIELAVYLEGYRPGHGHVRVNELATRLNSPHVGGHKRRSSTTDAGLADVWCVTTELGSWTARNESGMFLTGNSAWHEAPTASQGTGIQVVSLDDHRHAPAPPFPPGRA